MKKTGIEFYIQVVSKNPLKWAYLKLLNLTLKLLFLQGLKGSPMTLVFGCRNSDTDHLYKEETLDMRDNGILSNITTAYSRQTGKPKVE